MVYYYIFGTVFFTVYGQIIFKWSIPRHGELPDAFPEKITFLFNLLLDPFVLSGFVSAFIAAFFWMAVMTKADVSFAYPFMSIAFVLVFLLAVILFDEPFTIQKIIGLALIVLGIIVTSQSA